MKVSQPADGGWKRVAQVAACLFFSGLCGLIYQTVWLREFRLIFGASTSASAAVLAIFMGGVGAGSLVLGKKVDALGNSFHRYAWLEVGIAVTAALTPVLFWLARHAYIALGGTTTFGLGLGTALRLALATLVLLAPTFLMGGTLPAAVRAAQSEGDGRRRQASLLYGANTCGAVAGALLSTFYLLEHFGNRLTLWSACIANLLVATAALWLSQRPAPRVQPAARESGAATAATLPNPASRCAGTPPSFVFAAAAVTGFAFFLMELVWYRMLGPLLGGSTFTFGLILAIALAGIAAGSLGFSMFRGRREVSAGGFALVCALEAFFIAVPYALGDRLPLLTILLQPIGKLGFAASVVKWSLTTSILVLPASVLAGVQFPMLIALLGRGRAGVGAHTGLAYAWNTAGAIAGSLAGGFGLLPLLGAPGAWKLVVVLLVALAAAALWVQGRGEPRRSAWGWLAAPAVAGGAALAMLTAIGPTAVWRHSPIGAGRVQLLAAQANDFHDFVNKGRRQLVWDADGVESCVGLTCDSGFAFVVNGKIDGNARGDAGTQVMLGLVPAMLHPAPRAALVVGLGTGSTAGWLAEVPSMERVDVLELEPVIRRVAQDCAPVNRNALANPKVHLWLGDAREAMLTSRRQYDLIASEPSNPYRAGVASLFTREFYEAVARRLRPGGLFSQWVQGYEIDGESIGTTYATLASVFPYIETWSLQNGDLTFIASREPLVHDVAELRRQVGREPYRSALARVWRVTDLEGVFAHYVGRRTLADAVVANATTVNTDDRNSLEFAFARTVGRKLGFDVEMLLQMAGEQGYDTPEVRNGELDWPTVSDRRASALAIDDRTKMQMDSGNPGGNLRTAAKAAFAQGKLTEALQHWRNQTQEPGDLVELLLLAQGLAAVSDTNALRYIEQLRRWHPIEADAVLAQYHAENDDPAAFALAEKSLRSLHADPWPHAELMAGTLSIALRIAAETDDNSYALRLREVLREPFSIGQLEAQRMQARLAVSDALDRRRGTHLLRDVVAECEPHVPWTKDFLELRRAAYRTSKDTMTAKAEADWAKFAAGGGRPLLISTREQLAETAKPEPARSPAAPSGADRVQAREP